MFTVISYHSVSEEKIDNNISKLILLVEMSQALTQN